MTLQSTPMELGRSEATKPYLKFMSSDVGYETFGFNDSTTSTESGQKFSRMFYSFES